MPGGADAHNLAVLGRFIQTTAQFTQWDQRRRGSVSRAVLNSLAHVEQIRSIPLRQLFLQLRYPDNRYQLTKDLRKTSHSDFSFEDNEWIKPNDGLL